MKHTFTLVSIMILTGAFGALAADETADSLVSGAQSSETTRQETEPVNNTMATLPEYTTVLSGASDRKVHKAVLNALLDTRDLHFQDPSVPRYLFIDKEGSTLLGIGGYVEGVASADFRGAINSPGFDTYDIPVPSSSETRSRLGADVSHTTIFLKLIRNTRLGTLTAYVQSNFSGNDGGYGMKLKQAYVSLGDVTFGLTSSTFGDPSAGVPTIDYQGPSGQIGCKNIMLRYRADVTKNWTVALSAEMPKASYSPVGDHEASLNQNIPDIPFYVQYNWGSGSHLRAGGVLRTLRYRDLVDGTNRHETGYGVQLSGIYDINRVIDIYFQGAYGRGIGHYVNDLNGCGYDLVGSASRPGAMIAPRTASMVAGAKVNLTDRIFMSGAYSFNRLYDQSQLGPDSYLRANYIVANVFYEPINDLTLGVEYLHGTRYDVSRDHGCANRLEVMFKYEF